MSQQFQQPQQYQQQQPQYVSNTSGVPAGYSNQTTSYSTGASVPLSGSNTTGYSAQTMTTYNKSPSTLQYQGSAVSSYPTGGYTTTGATGYTTGGYSTTNAGNFTERVESTRQVSSTIVHEEYVGQLPQLEEVSYVEVPYYEEVIKHVPRKEIVEVEKRVPKYEYEWVERIVEIPQVQWVDKHVDVPQIQEVIRHVPKVQIVDVPTEVLRHVPKIEIKMVEKLVEVPGQIIEVPKPYTVENKVNVTRYNDREVNMVVAQSVKPVLIEGQGHVDVQVNEYEPECVPVDVHVIKPVSAHITPGNAETVHKIVTVPAAQYNSMLKSLNVHLGEAEISKLPYLTEAGRVPFLSDSMRVGAQLLSGAIVTDQFGNVRTSEIMHQQQQGSRYVQQSGMMGASSGMIGASTGYTQTTTTSNGMLNSGMSATTASVLPSSSVFMNSGNVIMGGGSARLQNSNSQQLILGVNMPSSTLPLSAH